MTSAETTAVQFPHMLKLANELGCQLRPMPTTPDNLSGLCPFHESKNLHEAKTLRVDIKNGRFWCSSCERAGTPVAFIAMT